jgi:hypothetical protein
VRFVQAKGPTLRVVHGWALGLVLSGCIACGARTELFEEEPSSTWTESTSSSGSVFGEPSRPTQGQSEPGRADILDRTQLPECKLGPAEQPGRECAFEVDGRCYDSGPEACACVACEQHTCVWEFPDSNGTKRLNYCE